MLHNLTAEQREHGGQYLGSPHGNMRGNAVTDLCRNQGCKGAE